MLKTWITGCLICCACVTNGSAQNSRAIRIYGEVTTVMNRKICGYITWGKNLYWTDIFTAGKIGSQYMRYRDIMGDNVRFSDGRRDTPPEHEFSCRFGNIRSIRVIGDRRIELGVKGGNVTELERGRSLAIGNWITVELRDGKTESVVWDHISEIVFSAAPDTIPEPKDHPIAGIVETPYGMYKGLVQWDLDENSLDALLDGRMESSGISVAFKNIGSIKSLGNSSLVTLHSGRELYMWGENDVNATNRGIAINLPSVGQVIVGWHDFKLFRSIPLDQLNLPVYDDFAAPERLSGRVETRDGLSLEGVLVYDLDEAMDFELLDGQNGNISYRVPFKYVQEIEPKNYKYTWVKLSGGTELVLGTMCDVTAANDGILVFRAGGEVVYVRWRDVKRVELWTKVKQND